MTGRGRTWRVALLLAACAPKPDTGPIGPGPSDADTDADTDTDTPGPGCVADWSDALGATSDFSAPLGEFAVVNAPHYGFVSGSVADGPPLVLHVESAREGMCRLMTYTPSYCDPPCVWGAEVCIDGACTPYPGRLSAGTLVLTVAGVEHTLNPDPTRGYYEVLPAAMEGALSLAGFGAEVPAFEVGTCAVLPVTATGDWTALLARRDPGEDVVLAWSDPEPAARVRLRMTTGVATHGGVAHAEIECEGPDVGSLTIPGSYLDELYSEGWSCGECGSNELQRYRSGKAAGQDIRLTVEAPWSFWYIP